MTVALFSENADDCLGGHRPAAAPTHVATHAIENLIQGRLRGLLDKQVEQIFLERLTRRRGAPAQGRGDIVGHVLDLDAGHWRHYGANVASCADAEGTVPSSAASERG